jgi:antitoxin VapB
MALRIKNAQADELARALAVRAGLTAELRAISDLCADLPDYDTRSPEEIIGFDEHGLPV